MPIEVCGFKDPETGAICANPVLPWAGRFDPAISDEDLAHAPSETFTTWCEVHRHEPAPQETIARGVKERIIQYELRERARVRSESEAPRLIKEWRGNEKPGARK